MTLEIDATAYDTERSVVKNLCVFLKIDFSKKQKIKLMRFTEKVLTKGEIAA